ncbi:MAG: c-type cytochrome [Betaproteobacteria bacterium]|nr:c-type cytochrome [Betaproteobacteria bacterium]
MSLWSSANAERREPVRPTPERPTQQAPGGDLAGRGEYLVRAGNCAGCHTARGGEPFAGGRGVTTPFGIVYAPNLTPDATTGLGEWTADDFWLALHEGKARDGRELYPAFPYVNYTLVTREDSDAMFAFLCTLPAVHHPNRPHDLRPPFDSAWLLRAWRMLYFRPGSFTSAPDRSASWNRGAYLVRGLGHCNACHTTRNALGAANSPEELGGGVIAGQKWYAPSLHADDEAGVAKWKASEIVELFATGHTRRATALGPMAEVIHGSTQYLTPADLEAIAEYLQSLPQAGSRESPASANVVADQAMLSSGRDIYGKRCAGCHGDDGEGAGRIYPPLRGNRAVTMTPPLNTIRVVLAGGFAPTTAANPRPYGMPPFATILSDEEIAAVVTYIRQAWGNRGPGVSAVDVYRLRGDLLR